MVLKLVVFAALATRAVEAGSAGARREWSRPIPRSRPSLPNSTINEKFAKRFRKSPVSATHVPHIVHFAVLFFADGQGMPAHLQAVVNNSETLAKDLGWDVMTWTPESAARLITDSYPWFLPAWRRLDSGIKRADTIRPIVLHKFGGVYLDADTAICSSTLEFVAGLRYLSNEPKFVLWGYNTQGRAVVQSSAAATQGHYVARAIIEHIYTSVMRNLRVGVLDQTGPRSWWATVGGDAISWPNSTKEVSFVQVAPQLWANTGPSTKIPGMQHMGVGSWIPSESRKELNSMCKHAAWEGALSTWLKMRCTQKDPNRHPRFKCKGGVV